MDLHVESTVNDKCCMLLLCCYKLQIGFVILCNIARTCCGSWHPVIYEIYLSICVCLYAFLFCIYYIYRCVLFVQCARLLYIFI